MFWIKLFFIYLVGFISGIWLVKGVRIEWVGGVVFFCVYLYLDIYLGFIKEIYGGKSGLNYNIFWVSGI